ncbi:MAG: tetratricopeptide repeat protein [Candidatus Methanoplasma sp.]|nr:tetratricopeptide repeat protein [Candidatus Methanoplasma sp.]
MVHEPVFRDGFEVDLWRKLTSGKDIASRKSDHYVQLAGVVTKREGPTSSAILSLLIRKLHETQSSNLDALISQLVSKSRPNDSVPALTAALIYADLGRPDKSEEMIGLVKHAQNTPMLSCVRARIAMDAGDTAKARKELIAARCSDPTYPMFYDLIQRIEPAEGWMYRQNIELLVRGGKQIPFGDNTGSSPVQKLYEIYKEWYTGNRDGATKAMIDSEEYSKKNSEYVLASARMSMDEGDWHSAQMMYSSLLEKSSNCVYIICETANAFYFGENYEKALSLYRDADALDPASPAVMRGLIQTYSAMDRRTEASQFVKEYLDSESADREAHIFGARMMLSNAFYADAGAIADDIMTSYPDDPDALIIKSESLFQTGNFNSALKTISYGVDRNPENADMRVQKAKILLKTGKSDKAVAELERAGSIDPGNKEVILLMNDISRSGKRSEDAAKPGRRIFKTGPGGAETKNTTSKADIASDRKVTYAEYMDILATDKRVENFINILFSLMNESRYAEVVQMFGDKQRDYGNYPLVRRLKGNAEYATGNYRSASASFASALDVDPKDPVIWHSKGMADEAMGDLKNSEEAYNRAILLNMNEPEYWISRSSVLEKKNDLSGAVDALNRVIELRPADIYALVKKGMIFAEMGRYEEAMYFMNMAAITEPDNIDVFRIQCDIATAFNDFDKAEEAAMRMTELDPNNDEGIIAAARILIARGKGDEAVKMIDAALQRDQNSIPILIAKKEHLISTGDNKAVIAVCKRILSIQPDNSIVKKDLAAAYAEAGDLNAANRLYSEIEVPKDTVVQSKPPVQNVQKQKVQEIIKRQAERVLRRAYITKLPLSDPDLISPLGLDDDTAYAVLGYLSDMSEYGSITPGTPEFERMEKLSFNAITKGNCAGLEEDPIISIPCAFVAGGARDADEAKLLVAYIYKVLTSKKSTEMLSAEMKKIAESTPKGTKIEEIMQKQKIGIYQAKMIKGKI